MEVELLPPFFVVCHLDVYDKLFRVSLAVLI